MGRRVVRYSEAFKREIVRELEGGRFANPDQISRRYGIRGAGTVKRWAEQYGRPGLLKPGKSAKEKRSRRSQAAA